MSTSPDVVVIGAGIVGLATARALINKGVRNLVVLEKESQIAQHQSTHNSGVLHCGLHYAPGSARARLARAGIRSMTEYCITHGIAHEICGKLVVAVSDDEVPRLRNLQDRGEKNGLRGLRWLTAAEAKEIEPNAQCVAALHVPEEGIADYRAVCRSLANEITAAGQTVRTSSGVQGIQRRGNSWVLETAAGEVETRFLVNCAGLHVDRVARMAGEKPSSRIVPFRGEYYKLRSDSTLVRNLIYPVPDPAFPFLGVHFTRLALGGVEAGPNAVLAFAREGYHKSDVNVRDLASALGFRGLWRFILRHPRAVYNELLRSFSRRLFLSSLQRLVPALTDADLAPGGAGVRAQALTPSGELVNDFLWIERPGAVHVLNAPSPAATASLAIGEEIASRVPTP